MTLEPVRGVKFAASSALAFAIVTPINNYVRSEPVAIERIVIGAVFAFLFFGLVGTLTGKLGSEVGES